MDHTTFSSWPRLIAVTAAILCFAVKMISTVRQAIPACLHISPRHLAHLLTNIHPSPTYNTCARLYWIRVIQQQQFPEAWLFLTSQSPAKPKIVDDLRLSMDAEDKIIRVAHRLATDTNNNTLQPILLPHDHQVTELIFIHAHETIAHSGTQATLAYLRTRYWIPRARPLLNRLIKKCTHCRRSRGGPYKLPSFPDLPPSRVTVDTPFKHTGLDFFGPINYTMDGIAHKAWVLLLCCLTCRATHLEITTALTAAAFLNAFRRFTSRRGVPSYLISDNQSTFIAVRSYWNNLTPSGPSERDVWSYFAAAAIQWHTIIPHAPYQGGIYERIVGLSKQALKATYGRRRVFDYDNLITNTIEAEAVLNSRPLCYVPADVDSYQLIRPSDFICPSGHTALQPPPLDLDYGTDPDYTEGTTTAADRLLALDKRHHWNLQNAWTKWHDLYLNTLRERAVESHQQGRFVSELQPAIGHVVLIADPNSKRGEWRSGIITELLRSSTGVVDGAVLRLSTGTYISRPIGALYPFELHTDTAIGTPQDGPDAHPTIDQISAELSPTITPTKPAQPNTSPTVRRSPRLTTTTLLLSIIVICLPQVAANPDIG